ncbi:MAG: hypothetical protein IJ109_06980 [Firmicutes bacterium]|nr:hypothetical protein [Bacillota bacterium]
MKKKIFVIALTFALVIILPAITLLAARESDNLSPGWHGKGDGRYYVLDDGSRAEGYLQISGKPYYFNENGAPADKGWIGRDSEETYYCEGGGELATGWKYLEKKVWYFYQASDPGQNPVGLLARSYTTPGQITLDEDGCVDGDEALALAYGMDVLNRTEWTLEAAYKYSASLRFEEGADEHYGFTTCSCALYGFEHGAGNCLAWSGTFCVMARLLGYDCRQIWGTLSWKGIRPHAWTEIWTDGQCRVYDPRKHDGEDMAGFDVQYGDKGTYKYDLDSKEYLEFAGERE